MSAPTTSSSQTVLALVLDGTGICGVTVRDRRIIAHRMFDHDSDPVAVLAALSADIEYSANDPVALTLTIGGLLTALLADGSTDAGVAVVRIVPRPASDARLGRNPRRRVERLVRSRFSVRGGCDLFGRPVSALDVTAVTEVADRIAAVGIGSIVVVGSGSTAHPHQERQAADILQSRCGAARITLAGDLGGQGFVARESTAVHDAALFDPVDRLLGAWESAAAHQLPGSTVHVARSDGGWSTLSWARNHPVILLSSDLSSILLGAAAEAGSASCRVRIDTPAGPMEGEVRDQLVVVGTDAWASLDGTLGWDLVIPQAELSTVFAHPWPADEERGDGAFEPVVEPKLPHLQLAGLGTAVSAPSAWVDEVAYITTSEQLTDLREDVRTRVITLATANGATPGSALVVEMSAIAMPFTPAGTVRITARATGSAGSPRPLGAAPAVDGRSG